MWKYYALLSALFAACIAVLLLLAKIDNRQYGQMEDINLARFLKEQASYLQSITGDIFFYEKLTNSALTVRANRTLLESLVNNLEVNPSDTTSREAKYTLPCLAGNLRYRTPPMSLRWMLG